MKFLPLVLKNLLRNRRRSLLTLSSLGISLCLLGVMMAVYYALYLQDASPAQALRLVTRHKVALSFAMPQYYGDKIRQTPGVREAAISQWFGGLYKDEERDRSKFFPRFAVEADRLFRVYPEWMIPEDQKQAFLQDRTGCIIGEALARKQNLKIGDKVVLKGNIWPFDAELTVRGIFASKEADENLYFQLKYLEEALRARGSDRAFAGMFMILADSVKDVPRIQRSVDDMFANTDAPTRTESEQAFQLGFLSFLGNIKMILISVCGAVTFTILLIAANTMAMSVRERVREVGVLKTLGYRQGTILGMILGEAAILSLLGGALGLIGAQVLCGGLRENVPLTASMKSLTIQPPVLAMLLGVALGVGLLSALVPAWSASRTPILDALRFTD